MNAPAIEEPHVVKQTRRHIATNQPGKEHVCELITTVKLLRISFLSLRFGISTRSMLRTGAVFAMTALNAGNW
jgi:ribosomal protein L29